MGFRVQGLRFGFQALGFGVQGLGFRAVWRHGDKVHVGIWYILRLQSRYMGSPSGHKYIPYTCMDRLGLIWGLQWLQQGCTVAVHAFVPYATASLCNLALAGAVLHRLETKNLFHRVDNTSVDVANIYMAFF